MKKTLATALILFIFLLPALPGCGDSREPSPSDVTETGEPQTCNGTDGRQPETPDESSDGSSNEAPDPSGLSGLENLLRIKKTMESGINYSASGYSLVSTKVLFFTYEQEVWTYKDCRDGVMIQTDIAKSTFVNSAWQTCFFGGKAYMRGPASGSAKNWDGKDTEWATDAPKVYDEARYNAEYGLFGTALSVYLLDPDTVESVSAPADNGDGTYSITVVPDVEKATAYYRTRMKTMGDLSRLPEFSGITIEYVFDSSWRLVSSHTEERYAVKMGVISSDDCLGVVDFTYSYGNADISDYAEFFSGYAK